MQLLLRDSHRTTQYLLRAMLQSDLSSPFRSMALATAVWSLSLPTSAPYSNILANYLHTLQYLILFGICFSEDLNQNKYVSWILDPNFSLLLSLVPLAARGDFLCLRHTMSLLFLKFSHGLSLFLGPILSMTPKLEKCGIWLSLQISPLFLFPYYIILDVTWIHLGKTHFRIFSYLFFMLRSRMFFSWMSACITLDFIWIPVPIVSPQEDLPWPI